MPIKNKNLEVENNMTTKEKAFEFQLQTLTLEIEYIERAIARLDEMTQTTKQWAILIWSGSISVILSQQTLKQYIFCNYSRPRRLREERQNGLAQQLD